MISSIRGEVLDVALDHAVIEANGVGYRINATPSTLSTLRRGTEARLVTAMIVREDSMTLYGFADADARDLFSTLLSVSGVGPKIALALAKGVPLSVRIERGSPKSLKARSNTVNAGSSRVLVKASQQIR